MLTAHFTLTSSHCYSESATEKDLLEALKDLGNFSFEMSPDKTPVKCFDETVHLSVTFCRNNFPVVS